jgi:hypothetical protein
MLTLIFMIAFMSTVIEFAIMWWMPKFRHFMEHRTWARVPFSLVISFILGAGGGQIVVVGAMIVSTGFSILAWSIHLLEFIEVMVDCGRRAKRAASDLLSAIRALSARIKRAFYALRHPILARRSITP